MDANQSTGTRTSAPTSTTTTYREGDPRPDGPGVTDAAQEEDGPQDAGEDLAAEEGKDHPDAGHDHHEDEAHLDHRLGVLHVQEEAEAGEDDGDDGRNDCGGDVAGVVELGRPVEGAGRVDEDDRHNRRDVPVQEESKEGVVAARLGRFVLVLAGLEARRRATTRRMSRGTAHSGALDDDNWTRHDNVGVFNQRENKQQ